MAYLIAAILFKCDIFALMLLFLDLFLLLHVLLIMCK